MRMIRFVVGAVALMLASLTILPAPTGRLWLVEIGITEWGYWLAPLVLLLLLRRRSRWDKAGGVLGLAAAILLLGPPIRAAVVGDSLPALMAAVFDGRPGGEGVTALAPASLLAFGAPAVPRPDTVIYAMPSGHALMMDLYASPQTAGSLSRLPAVVVIHGGSWQSGDRTQLAALNAHLASRGYLVAGIDYRLAPQWRFPAPQEDVRAAVAYLKRRSRELGIDPTRIALLGRSAGAQIALLAAYTLNDPAIRGVVAFYPPSDLRHAYEHPANPAVLDSRGMLEAYLGGRLEDMPAMYDHSSPIYYVGTKTPPTLLLHGDRDELVFAHHSGRLAERLADARRPHLLVRLPWATHGCDVHFHGPCGQISTYAVTRFLATVLAP
jgi:acetyl esterase/lipase